MPRPHTPTRLLRGLIRAFPVVFLAHDLEEVLMAEAFLREHRDSLPLPPALRRYLLVTTRAFALAVALLFVPVAGLTERAARAHRRGPATEAFATMVGVLFLNVFNHAGMSLWLRRYTPGVGTAVALALPYSLIMLWRLRHEHFVRDAELPGLLRRAALIGVLMAVGAQAIARVLTRGRAKGLGMP